MGKATCPFPMYHKCDDRHAYGTGSRCGEGVAARQVYVFDRICKIMYSTLSKLRFGASSLKREGRKC